MKRTLPLLAALLSCPVVAPAAITETYAFNNINLAIPDGNPSGAVDHRIPVSSIGSIDTVVVTLQLTGTFNGDLYAWLSHDTGFAVLLNRPGKSASSSFGYEDDGMDILLDDSAASDVHAYRDSSIPLAGVPLTGIWQPDGRTSDPANVLPADARPAMLNTFQGLSGGGSWTLFLADLSGGDPHVLQSWSLAVTGTAIPEPSTALFLTAVALSAIFPRRRPR